MIDQQPNRLAAAIDSYVEAVYREVLRIIGAVHGGFDADDIAQTICAQVLANATVVMTNYPDPARYVHQRTRHAAISHDRRQRVQRGEGVRLFKAADGTVRPGRPYVSGDAPGRDGSDPLFAHARSQRHGFEADIDEWVDATAELRRWCQGIPPAHLHEVILVDGWGYSVLEIATMCGQARETVSRRLNQTRRRIRQNRAAMPHREETPG